MIFFVQKKAKAASNELMRKGCPRMEKKSDLSIRRREWFKLIVNYKVLLLMMIPALLYFIIFCYLPMYGVVLAFKDYRVVDGIMGSPWVGMKYFEQAFEDPYFLKTVSNTIMIGLLKLLVGFPVPILFAVLLNELQYKRYKKLVQTVSYLPYFMSWVILGSIFFSLFSLDGPVNSILSALGFEKIMFMSNSGWFRPVLILTDVWKGFGWGSVLYLAAIAGIDQQIYEAAKIDGANRFQTIWHMTLPSILPVICINLILSLSGIMNAGFDQIFNMYNETVYDVADIIDTYVYRLGIKSMEYSLSTAVGLFKSAIGLVMVVSVNFLVRKVGGKENALW